MDNGFPFIFIVACAMFVAWPDPVDPVEENEMSEVTKKAIFLDIDGVLNSNTMLRQGLFKTGDKSDMICPKMLARLERILVAHPDVLIVLSSSWRKNGDDAINAMKTHGFSRGAFDGQTGGSSTGHRGEEIQTWLDDHPEVTKFIILDDELQGMLHLEEFVVKTSWESGMFDRHADEAIERLND